MSVLQNHIRDAADHPDIRERMEQHLRETERHADMVQRCVEHLGSTTSSVKDAMGRISGMLSGASTGMAADELVKNALSDYSMEHFEIASYKAIIAAAESLGETEVADTCRDILQDEERMAHWLEEHLPDVVHAHLGHQPVS